MTVLLALLGCKASEDSAQAVDWELVRAVSTQDGDPFGIAGPILHDGGVVAVVGDEVVWLDQDRTVALGIDGAAEAVWSGGPDRLVVQSAAMDGQGSVIDLATGGVIWETAGRVHAVVDGVAYGWDETGAAFAVQVQDGAAVTEPIGALASCVETDPGVCCTTSGLDYVVLRQGEATWHTAQGTDAVFACAVHPQDHTRVEYDGATWSVFRVADGAVTWTDTGTIGHDFGPTEHGVSADAASLYLAGWVNAESEYQTYRMDAAGIVDAGAAEVRPVGEGVVMRLSRRTGLSLEGPGGTVDASAPGNAPAAVVVLDGVVYATFTSGSGGGVSGSELLEWLLTLGYDPIEAQPTSGYGVVVRSTFRVD